MPALDQALRVLERSLAAPVVTDPVELTTYAHDASIDRATPDAVAFPQSAEEVVEIVRWAGTHRIPLIARGAGTGLSGGAVPEHGGLIVGMARMNTITDLNTAGRRATVQMGVVNLVLDTQAKGRGLYYPPDPASGRSATIGGNIAENAGGPHCFKYGVTTNYVTGLDMVLADGERVRLGGRALDYPEYDLAALVTGSEGTLGIITSAELRLIRNPPAVKTMMAAFDSVESAGAAVSALIAAGLVPATMEMMDQKMMRIIEEVVHVGLPITAGAALIIEADGYAASVAPQIEEFAATLRAHGGFNLHIAETAEERDKIWYGRKSAAGAMARLSPAYYLVDGTVPRSKLAATLAGVNQICDAADLRVGYVFHAGDGNLHPFILIERPNDAALIEHVVATGREILALCVSYGGSITGEHGVGIEKRAFMPLMYSETELDIMRNIKQVFDPTELLNPGKIIPPRATPATPLAIPPATRSVEPALLPTLAPGSAEEAAEYLHTATRAGCSVGICGAGTQPCPHPTADLSLSTAQLRGVRTYARDDLYVTIGAGTPLAEVQAELQTDRMWVPLVAPNPNSTIGGIVSANANGPQRMRYGSLRDLVLAATVVLADGRVIRAGRPVVKNVAGYDLPKLFVGAYGTLGFLADVTLKLAPLPRARASLVVPVPDLAHGLAWGAPLVPLCLVASALLLCDAATLPDLGITAPYALIYTAEGLAADVAAELADVRATLARAGAPAPIAAPDLAGAERFATWLRAALASGEPVLRLGVAADALPGLARQLAAPRQPLLCDLANGMLYTRGTLDIPAAQQRAAALGGYGVMLHGDAAARWGAEPSALRLMRALKQRWDPAGLLNPGVFRV